VTRVAIINELKVGKNGGAETWIKEIGSLLCRHGVLVDVISPEDRTIPDSKSICFREITYQSILYKCLKKLSIYNYFYMFVFPPKNIDLSEYDVVYTISFYHGLIALRTSKKVVIGTHDFFLGNSKINIDIFRFPWIILLRFLMKRKNVFLHALNEITAAKVSGISNKTYLIGNNVIVESLEPCGKQEKFTVLFLGKTEKRKGGEILKQLALMISHQNDMKLRIVGTITKDFRNIITQNNTHNVVATGFVDNEEKKRELKQSHLFLMLSERESYSIVSAEALSAGMPVISTWKPLTQIQKLGQIYTIDSDPLKIFELMQQKMKEWNNDRNGYASSMKQRAFDFALNVTKSREYEKYLEMFSEKS